MLRKKDICLVSKVYYVKHYLSHKTQEGLLEYAAS